MIHETQKLKGNGLTLHVHRFEPDAPPHGKAPLILFLHGFMDAGGTIADVALPLCARGLSVIAPDFRGFGRSDRVSGGGYYHFADYVADVDALWTQLAPERLVVVGHSMGGTVASYFTAARPERVHGLVLLEGVGPPDMTPDRGPTRMRSWLRQLAQPKASAPLESLEQAVSRLAQNHPNVDRQTLLGVARYLVVEANGALSWAFDDLHRTTAPTLFRADTFRAFLSEIHCPVLFVSGGTTGWHPPDEAERLSAFPTPPEVVVLEGAGHMMHWTQPAAVADAIATFALGDRGR